MESDLNWDGNSCLGITGSVTDQGRSSLFVSISLERGGNLGRLKQDERVDAAAGSNLWDWQECMRSRL